MIAENLYPTRTTYNVGYTANQYQDETTAQWLTEYSGETVNDMSAYWLGWISPDNLPLQYRLSAIYVDSETGEYCFDDITDKSNFPCGYVNITTNVIGYMTAMKYVIDGVEDYRSARVNFLNNVHPEFSGMMRNYNESIQFLLTAYYILFDGGGNIIYPTSWNGYLPSVSIFDDQTANQIIEAYNFLFDDATRQITIRYSGTDYNFTFTSDDFADGTVALWDDTNTVQARLFLVNMRFGQGGSMNNTTQTNLRTSWCCQVTGNHDGHSVTKLACGSGVNITGVNTYTMSRYTKENPGYEHIGYAQNVKFPAEIVSAIKRGTEKYHWINNMLAYHISSEALFLPFYPMDSIRKMFSLFYRVSLTGMNGYVKNFTYATDVNSNNEFLAKLKTGNLSDASFKSGLREWQYTDFQADEFDEEDIPPYSPEPEPGGDDTPDDEPEDMEDAYGEGDEYQDDILITSPTQFITQYILTTSQLSTVGSNLWSSWNDPNTDVYKNFLFDFFQDTGTFNITAALDYIISLRIYPFSLSGMSIEYLGVSNGVYMGTGHTNFCPGNIPTLNVIIGALDAGTLDVNLHVPYKDFRDLYNCSVMVFLPYCGTVELNPVEVIGKKLHATYYIDFQSGACTAVIRVNNDGVEYTIASKSGQIGFMLPVTATNSGQLAAQYVGDATRAIGTLSGLFFDVAGSVGRSAENAVKIMSAGEGAEESAPTGMTVTESLHVGKSGVKAALGLANQATDMLSRSGIDMPMLSGGAGAESLFMPPYVCLQVRRGKYAKPNNYPHSVGYYNLSSNPISYYRGAYSGSPATGSNTGKGFCTFTGVDTSGLDCREDERAEILELLNTGIYL